MVEGPKAGPFLGLELGSVLKQCFYLSPAEVSVFWQWYRFLERTSDKPLLPLSLDETSVSFFPKAPCGTICCKTDPHIRVNTTCQRGSCTVIAIVCADAEVQKVLPQFILANEHGLPVHVQRRLSPPGNVHVLRGHSAWNCSNTMLAVLDALSQALEPYVEFCRPTLVMDCAPCHLSPDVLAQAWSRKIRVVLVPSRLTPLVQVLDVFVFKGYKSLLERSFEELRSRHPNSNVPTLAWFEMLIASLTFLARDWGPQFGAVLGGGDVPLTRELDKLQLDPMACARRPSEDQLASILPRRKFSRQIFQLLFGSRRVVHAVRV